MLTEMSLLIHVLDTNRNKIIICTSVSEVKDISWTEESFTNAFA